MQNVVLHTGTFHFLSVISEPWLPFSAWPCSSVISDILFLSRIHKDIKRTVDLCQKAESAGVSWITVHGRTSDERHQPVHYDAIKTIKDSLSVPVIANGDIKSPRDVESISQLTGVDGKHIIETCSNILFCFAFRVCLCCLWNFYDDFISDTITYGHCKETLMHWL